MTNNSNTIFYPFKTAYFSIQINNTGSNHIKNLDLGFYLNHSLIRSYNVSLPPYKGASIPINYTFNTSGTYNFEVIANPSLILNISNKSITKNSISIGVNNPQNILYIPLSLPSNNIKSLETFAIYGNGVKAVPFALIYFNKIDFLNNTIFSQKILSRILYDLSNHINVINGLYIKYNNNSAAYSSWLNGNINPNYIYGVMSTFSNIYKKNYSIQSNQTLNITNNKTLDVSFAKINNSSSICFFYQDGWTKIIAYNNNSQNSISCINLVGKSYSINTYNSIEKLFNNPVFIKNSSEFQYTNVSNIGLISTYSNNSYGLFNMFDSTFGTFISYIINNKPELSYLNKTCYGILFNENNSHICSNFIFPNNLSINYSVINSTEFTKNYELGIYSFLNNNLSITGSENAQALINKLKFNQTGLSWKTINSCKLNGLINCSYYNFDYSNSVASFNITNKMNASIKINTIACYNPGLESNQTINKTISSGNSLILNVSCNGIATQITSAINSYNVTLNYTILNKTKIINGLFNLSEKIE